MRNDLAPSAEQLAARNRRKKIWHKLFLIFAGIVVFATTYALILPALTLEQTTFCGKEEHTHGDLCYEWQLVCGYEEAEGEEGHHHSDDCYEKVLICEKEEHVHVLSCGSDPEADLENEAVWNRSVSGAALTGERTDDLLEIARTQLGYEESTRNYIVSEGGEMKGITRYGQWFDDPYGDWSAMFVSFCLSYAGIPDTEVPYSADCGTWADALEEQGLYRAAGEYLPESGDIILLDKDGDGIPDSAGLVAGYSDSGTEIKVIAGDEDGSVGYARYVEDDTGILGYAELPKGEAPEGSSEEEITESSDTEGEAEDDPEGSSETEETEVETEASADEETEPSVDKTVDEETESEAETTVEPEAETEETTEAPLIQKVFKALGAAKKPTKKTEESTTKPTETTKATTAPAETTKAATEPTAAPTPEPETSAPAESTEQAGPGKKGAAVSGTDIEEYMQSHGGSLFLTLLDMNNQELPQDEHGNYIVSPYTQYKLILGLSLPNGILPGTYQYDLGGPTVNGGSGTFTLGDEEIGTWTVDTSGLMTFVFNENANHYSNVTISAVMGMYFTPTDEVIDFDGKITVVVIKPPTQEDPTELSKWGSQGNPQKHEGQDPGRIYWTVEMIGGRDSQIPGSVITDSIITANHRYTAADMADGITISISEKDPDTGEELHWHKWVVPADDPNLTWTETGWTYRMPTVAHCKYCGDIHLGSDQNWHYYIQYSSTPDPTDVVGSISYQNYFIADDQGTEGWASIKYGSSEANVLKSGAFRGAEDGGAFEWEVTVTIPGKKEGQKAEYFWYLWDAMRVKNANGSTIGYIWNDMDLAEVEVTYQGQTYTVPKIQEAGPDDLFAWDSSWEDDHDDGIYYGRQIDFYTRCTCTVGDCQKWRPDSSHHCGGHVDYKDETGHWISRYDFCRCWNVPDDAVFTFRYRTEDPEVIERYGASGNVLQNEVSVHHKRLDENNEWVNTEVGSSESKVPIPGLFKKELTQDYNGYVAKYTITVNEAKIQLTADGEPLEIHDMMTDTLAYISGSLVITTEDEDGQTGQLTYGEDYTIVYDGSGTQTDAAGKPVHVLDITILHPEEVMYTLCYDATLVIPEGVAGGVKYSNSASIELFGKTIQSGGEEKVYAEFNFAAKTYRLMIHKTDGETDLPLEGARFGMFNAQGEPIASGVTNSDGELMLRTDVSAGVILQSHKLYYVKELSVPTGYQLDETKHWLVFCDETGPCTYDTGLEGVLVIPGDQIGSMAIQNWHLQFNLPETGGTGSRSYTAGGLLAVIAAAITILLIHRKRSGSSN